MRAPVSLNIFSASWSSENVLKLQALRRQGQLRCIKGIPRVVYLWLFKHRWKAACKRRRLRSHVFRKLINIPLSHLVIVNTPGFLCISQALFFWRKIWLSNYWAVAPLPNNSAAETEIASAATNCSKCERQHGHRKCQLTDMVAARIKIHHVLTSRTPLPVFCSAQLYRVLHILILLGALLAGVVGLSATGAGVISTHPARRLVPLNVCWTDKS